MTDGPQQGQEQESVAPQPFGIRLVRNVTRPSVTVFLPPPALATGTAVVVCPGGAFHFLAIEHEGTQVAQWLNARGVAVFVLRYRLVPTVADEDGFVRQVQENLSGPQAMRELTRQIGPLAIADGQQAVRLVREQASAWGIAPQRIGIMGFSAGGVVTTGVAVQYDAASRPDFAAPIYGAPWESVVVPSDAPPLFIAVASDDPFAVSTCVPLYAAWTDADRSAELHIYARGGHGFGMRRQGLPVDGWIDCFGAWLRDQGLLPAAGEASGG
jgi:acetyl esterase/lipase